MRKNNKQSGFTPVEILIAFVTIGALVAVGYYVLMAQDDTKSEETNTTQEVTTTETDASSEAEAETAEAKTGDFKDIPPKTGSGNVTVTYNEDGTATVQIGDNFTVQEGPDLFIGFGDGGKVDKDTLFTELESLEGAQEYEVPETLDVSEYSQIFIYCKEFSASFSVADLQ